MEFWRPISSQGLPKLNRISDRPQNGLKRPQRILMNLQLLFEFDLSAIFVTNSINVQGGMCHLNSLEGYFFAGKMNYFRGKG